MGKITIIEGNSNDKDNIRLYMTKGEKGDKGDKGEDGTGTKLSDLENDMDFQTESDVTSLIEQKMLAMYPIGSIYITANNVNPSTFIGGSWQQVATGQFLVGVGTGTDQNNVEKTFIAGENAGEYEHTLSENELPLTEGSVELGQYITTASDEISAFYGANGKFSSETTSGTRYRVNATEIVTRNRNNHLKMSFGNDEAHNITSPSFGLYVWQRTA